MAPKTRTKDELLLEVADLRLRMAEAEDVLRAIRDNEVDALVVRAPQGDQVYALESADDAYRQMVEQMREGAATLTPNGVVLFANQQLAQLLDCPLEKIIGEPFARCLPPADRPRLAALLNEPEGGRTPGFLQAGDASRIPVSFSASRMLVDEQSVVLLLITDLTYENQADRVARLLQLTTRLSVEVTQAHVAEAIVNSAIQAFDAAYGLVAVPLENGARLRTLHAVGYAADRARQIDVLPLPLENPVSEAARRRAPVVIESVEDWQQRYPHWPAPSPEAGIGALLALPLLLPERLVGVLQVGFRGDWSLDPDNRDFALTVAQECAQSLERASLYSELEARVQARTGELQAANDLLAGANRQLQEEIAERRAVQRQLERSREEERTRVARELHDELGGSLTVLKMDVSRVLKAEVLSASARQQLTDVNSAIDAAVRSMRRLATELRPQVLDGLGLLPALETHFQEFIKHSGLSGEFVSTIDELALTGEAATACFRIFQEALTNIMRHAQATQVVVQLEPEGEAVLLRVTDNGRGMRLEERTMRGHLGLVGMQERASLLAAPLEIISAPGQGTTVLVRIQNDPAVPSV